jgi:maltose O-acetyltransferase
MKRKLRRFLDKWFSGFLPYQAMVGGYEYYLSTKENAYDPKSFLYYGKNVRIEAGTGIFAPERLHIGDDTRIGGKCVLHAVGGCHIGKGCAISLETIIVTIEHSYNAGESLPYDRTRFVKPVYIEDYVWLGTRTCVMPGVRIGEGAIVAMGSVVVQDVPPLAIVGGNPGQILSYRSKEDFERAKSSGAMIDPYGELPLLKVPPITKRKYRNELPTFGFDMSKGSEYFNYNKLNPPGQRLVPVEGPKAAPKQ